MVVASPNTTFSGRRCLVTGGGGFIGSALIERLLKEGAYVSGFGRTSAVPSAPNLTWVHGSFEDPMTLVRACEGQDYVFHLLNSSTPESATLQPVGDIIGNVVPTVQLLEACRLTEVENFVFASSGGTVYGISPQIPIPETAPIAPISAYGVSKATIEKYIAVFGHIHGLKYKILRVSNPYGPGQSPHKKQGVVAALMYKALAGEPIEIWGDGNTVRDYIYIDDLAEAFVKIGLYNGPEKIFNVGSGIGQSVNDIVNQIKTLLSQPDMPITYKPSRKVDVPVNILDMSRVEKCIDWKPRVTMPVGLELTRFWLENFAIKHSKA